MNNQKGMRGKQKQRYTQGQKSWNVNNKKALGKRVEVR